MLAVLQCVRVSERVTGFHTHTDASLFGAIALTADH